MQKFQVYFGTLLYFDNFFSKVVSNMDLAIHKDYYIPFVFEEQRYSFTDNDANRRWKSKTGFIY